MANQYIVKSTIHALPKKGGKKVIIKPSKDPQTVPAEYVKDLLARGAIEAVEGQAPSQAVAVAAGGDQGQDDQNDDSQDD